MIILLLFILGLVFGSFLNVVISRTIAGEDFIHGRSRCDVCKKQIAWYDNIPLLSYILLKGRCRYCKKPISLQHPVIELLTGMLFVWWYAVGFAFFQLAQEPLLMMQRGYWLAVGVLLLIIVVADWLYMIIPDYAVIGLGVITLLYRFGLASTGAMQWQDVWTSLLAGLVSFGFFFLLWFFTKGKGMGFGDVKFVLVMGWILGWQRTIVGIFLAFLIGALVGVVIILLKKKTLNQQIPFGPFLVLGLVISLISGWEIWSWYLMLLQ